MRKILAAALILLLPLCALPALAQQNVGAFTVASCGTPPAGFGPSGSSTWVAGVWYPVLQDTTGKICDTGSGGGTSSVNIAQVNGVTVLTGAGATGTGSQRTTVAQDATTIAGSAPGTAGSASANVVSVQGIAGGTPAPVTSTPATATPIVGAAVAVATGGTAVSAVAANANGCVITNPLTTTDQGIGTVEPLYVNPVTTATTTGNTSTFPLAPGQSFNCVPRSTIAVSVNAATTAHKFTVVSW
jgi:hypothetical protein